MMLPILALGFFLSAVALAVPVLLFGDRLLRAGMSPESLSTLRLGSVSILLTSLALLAFSLEPQQ